MQFNKISNIEDDWLQNIIKISDIGYWQLNLKSKEIKWSKQIYDIHQKDYNFHPTIDKIKIFYDQTDLNSLKSLIIKNYKNKNKFTFKLKYIPNNKTIHHLEADCQFIFQNNNYLLVGTLKDISHIIKKSKNLVKESKQLEKLIDHAEIAKGLITPKGNFLKTNKSLSELFGYSKDELLKMKHQDIIYPDDLEISKNFIDKIIKNKINSFQLEKRYIHKNGHIIYCLKTITVLRKKSGLPTELIIELVDITSHKINEKELSKTYDNLNLATESADIGLWDWNLENGKVFYSDKWCAMLGYKAHEIKPHFSSCEKILHPDDKPIIMKKLQDYFDNKISKYEAQIRLKNKSGNWSYIVTTGKVTKKDANNKPLRMIGTHIDISAQLQNSNILHDIFNISSSKNLSSKNKISHIIEKTCNYLNMQNAYIINMQNQKPKIIHKYQTTKNNLYIDNKFLNFCYNKNEIINMNNCNKFSSKNNLSSFISIPIYVNSKNYGIILIIGENSKKKYNKNAKAILKLICLWISEQIKHEIQIEKLKKSEKKLEISVNKLTESNEDLDRFAYMASHDLQEPLRIILSLTEIIKNRYGNNFDKKLSKYFNYIYNAAHDMRSLIKDLLDYSRIDENKYSNSNINPKNIIKDIILSFETSISNIEKNIIINNIPEIIHINSLLFQLLIQNLLSNAIKYQHPKRKLKITISAKENNNNTEFIIKDNGIGIEKDYFTTIFEPFKRLNTKTISEGSGIGLAICNKIIKKFNGTIWVKSEINQGSEFHFTIPNKPI